MNSTTVLPNAASSLDPQTGKPSEVGLRFALLGGRISGLVTRFDLLQDNVTSADPNRPGYFLQQSGQRGTDLEVSLNGRVTEDWLMVVNFSDTDARNDHTGVATELSSRFRLSLFNRFNLSRGAIKGLSCSVGSIYTSDCPLTAISARGEPNCGPLPAVWWFDTALGYKFRPSGSRVAYDFAFNVTNVRNRIDLYSLAAWDRAPIDTGRVWRFAVGVKF